MRESKLLLDRSAQQLDLSTLPSRPTITKVQQTATVPATALNMSLWGSTLRTPPNATMLCSLSKFSGMKAGLHVDSIVVPSKGKIVNMLQKKFVQ
mmetsp:Transcript_15590/g.28593  ORF Transcript_15590/g.28593 Transcript_15590/m.28593 type:complete len:95 (-) Transcript_15590:58-342(-)